MSDFKTDLRDSITDFKRLVQPKLIDLGFIEGRIRHVESNNPDAMCSELDRIAGIDAWVVNSKKGIFGLSSRIQWGIPYDTFTIRKRRTSGARTEYAKHTEAMSSGGVRGQIMVQAYVTRRNDPTSELRAVAVASDEDIWALIGQGLCFDEKNTDDDNEFIVISWKELILRKKAKYWIYGDRKPKDYSKRYKTAKRRSVNQQLF